jgi:hypothetical protein
MAPISIPMVRGSCGAGDVQLTVPLGHAGDVRLVGAFVIDESMAPPGSIRSNTKYTNAFAPSSSGEPQASAASRSACTAAPSSFRLRATRCDSTPPPSKSCGHLQVSHTDLVQHSTRNDRSAACKPKCAAGRKRRTPPPAAARAQLHLYAVVPGETMRMFNGEACSPELARLVAARPVLIEDRRSTVGPTALACPAGELVPVVTRICSSQPTCTKHFARAHACKCAMLHTCTRIYLDVCVRARARARACVCLCVCEHGVVSCTSRFGQALGPRAKPRSSVDARVEAVAFVDGEFVSSVHPPRTSFPIHWVEDGAEGQHEISVLSPQGRRMRGARSAAGRAFNVSVKPRASVRRAAVGLDLLCNPAACTFTPYQVLNILRSPGGRPMRSSEPIKLGLQTTMRAAVNVFALYNGEMRC